MKVISAEARDKHGILGVFFGRNENMHGVSVYVCAQVYVCVCLCVCVCREREN